MPSFKRRHWDSSCWQDLGEIDGAKDAELIEYVWPGGYPVVYVDPEDESEGLCAKTVREMIDRGEWPEGRSVDSYTHYEGPPVECTCGRLIEAAYGDPYAQKRRRKANMDPDANVRERIAMLQADTLDRERYDELALAYAEWCNNGGFAADPELCATLFAMQAAIL